MKLWAPARAQRLPQRKSSVRKRFAGGRKKPSTFSASSQLSLSFRRRFGKPAGSRGRMMEWWRNGVLKNRQGSQRHITPLLQHSSDRDVSEPIEIASELEFVPEPLLMPVRLHAFAAFVLGNFCLPSFLKRAHSDFSNGESIESSNSSQCKCSRRFGYLLSCDDPAAVFFLSCAPMPIFLRNGSIDCLRPKNFSIDSLTSRESPGS